MANQNVVLPSPFSIHPGDNPNLQLVTPPLDEHNYHIWSREMTNALISKNKIQFVDGTIPPVPRGNQMFDSWRQCNKMVLGWILSSVTPTIKQSVIWYNTAYEVWNDLEDRFNHGDSYRFSDLQEQFYALKQGLRRFFGRLCSLPSENGIDIQPHHLLRKLKSETENNLTSYESIQL